MNVFTEATHLPALERINHILQTVKNYSYNDWLKFAAKYSEEVGYMLANDIFHMSPEEKKVQLEGAISQLEKGYDHSMLFILLSQIGEHQLAMVRKCWLERIQISPSETYTHAELISAAHNLAKRLAGAFLADQIPESNQGYFFILTNKFKEELKKLAEEKLVHYLFNQILAIDEGPGCLSMKKFRYIERRVLGEL